jgi:hypothetical protein
MSLWRCPECSEASIVHVTHEFAQVYPRWAQFVSFGSLARALRAYGVEPRPSETGEELVRRWVGGDVDDGPVYLCTGCETPFSVTEVPSST